MGGGSSEYVDDVKYLTIKGVLYITTKRIVFVGGADGFDRKTAYRTLTFIKIEEMGNSD